MSDKLTLVFVVGGEDVPVQVNPNEPLHAARNKALAQSDNTGRPPDEWEIRDARGGMLDPDAKIGALGLASGARILLSLKVGAGG